MAEPKESASRLTPVVDGVIRWSVRESRIGDSAGESYAVRRREQQVLIDPLPLTAAALEKLGSAARVMAIVLTIQSHQRSAWRYARLFGVPVFAPRGAQGLDEKPARLYRVGDDLPLGLAPVALPGPAFSGHGFFWRSPEGSVLFCGDLITCSRGSLRFVPDQYMDAPAKARASARALLRRKIDVLCAGHGPPLVGDVKRALQRLIAADARGAA
jgi:glyoxylase-like metal-dependent hydrolase (beta-lactamase superfamily II)